VDRETRTGGGDHRADALSPTEAIVTFDDVKNEVGIVARFEGVFGHDPPNIIPPSGLSATCICVWP